MQLELLPLPICGPSVPEDEPVELDEPDPTRPPVEQVIASNLTWGGNCPVAGRRAARRHAP